MIISKPPLALPSNTNNVRIALSIKALRNICVVVAVLLGVNTGIDFFTAGADLPVQASLGRAVASLTLLVCALLAHFQKTVASFVLFSAAQIFAVYNAVIVAGFGLYSPALLSTLLIVVLSFGLFGYPRGWLWCSPSVATWFAVMITYGVVNPIPSDPQVVKGASVLPSPAAWIITQFFVGLVVAGIIRLYERQSAALLAEEQNRHAQTRDALVLRDEMAAEREKFMAHLSHELRTPLAAMRNAMSLAQHPKASDAMREKSLQTLDGAIGNLQALLNDALDSFKFSRGEFALHETEFAVAGFLQSIETLYMGLAEGRGLEFRVQTDAPEGTRLVGDTMRIGQMLSNLIANAIKFTKSGGVYVSFRKVGSEREVWRFEVRDTGPGISTKDQDLLFKPFMQIDAQQATDIKGTGLGLSIVAQLARAMGGKVGMTSEPDAGSVFYFEIPLRTVLVVPAELRAVEKPAATA